MEIGKESLKFNVIEDEVLKLELHKYAPELNRIHLKNGKTISTPNCLTIKGSINYIIEKNLWT